MSIAQITGQLHTDTLKIWFKEDKYIMLFFLWYTPGDRQWRKPRVMSETYEKDT